MKQRTVIGQVYRLAGIARGGRLFAAKSSASSRTSTFADALKFLAKPPGMARLAARQFYARLSHTPLSIRLKGRKGSRYAKIKILCTRSDRDPSHALSMLMEYKFHGGISAWHYGVLQNSKLFIVLLIGEEGHRGGIEIRRAWITLIKGKYCSALEVVTLTMYLFLESIYNFYYATE